MKTPPVQNTISYHYIFLCIFMQVILSIFFILLISWIKVYLPFFWVSYKVKAISSVVLLTKPSEGLLE